MTFVGPLYMVYKYVLVDHGVGQVTKLYSKRFSRDMEEELNQSQTENIDKTASKHPRRHGRNSPDEQREVIST